MAELPGDAVERDGTASVARLDPGGGVGVPGLEEAVGDEVRRLADLSAQPDRIQILQQRQPDVLAETRDLLEEWPADLVVVDSLSEYARLTLGDVPSNGDDAGWAAVIRPLVSLCRERNAAVVVLHHVRRSDGQYRGASEICGGR